MIASVLIANRGEIALRVMRTCRRLDIRTIAIYSDADCDALHVRQADSAYRVGPPPALQSYLNQRAILEVAKSSGAQAIHPGYGFLSENADFAEAVLAAGFIWVGPPPAAMRLLGEKAPAKALAEQQGVPVLPGYHGPDQRPQHLAKQAAELGFPLLIKASAGGGGRGMRLVQSPSDFLHALESAQREAQSSFGNQDVLLERYLVRPRHVEIQVFGDAYGEVVHLGERECSIQRRHQKLVEESPSPAVDAALRARMGHAAITLARAAGYQNAGTVELLLDQSGGFYFLELNARLQVEHPVTEMVTGLDLVELQFRVADGRPLGLHQDQIQMRGHAIETRVIAEDPRAGFLPSTGMIDEWSFPPESASLRLDSGFEVGSAVTPYYDSLLAKLIVRGDNRLATVSTLREALAQSSIAGPTTNLDLLLAVAEHPAFRSGDLHTGFLDEHRVAESLHEQPSEVIAAASALELSAHGLTNQPLDPWHARSNWRLSGSERSVHWRDTSGALVSAAVRFSGSGDDAHVALSDRFFSVRVLDAETASVDGAIARARLARDGRVRVDWRDRTYHVTPAGPPEVSRGGSAGTASDGAVTAPMPGRIVKLHVAQGQAVTERQPLLILESMKIEHVVTAPRAGKLIRLDVVEGVQVVAGALLAEIEAES